MKRSSVLKTILVVLIVLVPALYAQRQAGSTLAPSENFKFDEFGDIGETEWKQRLGKLAGMLDTYPDARVFAIVYTKIGEPRKSIDGLRRKYRDYFESLKPDSTLFTDAGGYRKQQSTELWIVGPENSFPEATPDERFKSELVQTVGLATDEEFVKAVKAFWIKQFDDPESQGFIINYGTEDEIDRRERLISNDLIRGSHDRSRLTLVRGGLKGEPSTAFWLVPPTAELPKP